MYSSITDDLRRNFDLASLRKEAGTLNRPEQWAEIKRVQTRCERARQREERLHCAFFDTRVEMTRRRLIDEAATTRRDLKPLSFGDDRFDPNAVTRQAQRLVLKSHERRLARIDDFECRSLGAIVERARQDNPSPTEARDEFTRVADRRDGGDRPAGQQRPRRRN